MSRYNLIFNKPNIKDLLPTFRTTTTPYSYDYKQITARHRDPYDIHSSTPTV
jgi:hypothetical protein